jgi:hypothetical protein
MLRFMINKQMQKDMPNNIFKSTKLLWIHTVDAGFLAILPSSEY